MDSTPPIVGHIANAALRLDSVSLLQFAYHFRVPPRGQSVHDFVPHRILHQRSLLENLVATQRHLAVATAWIGRHRTRLQRLFSKTRDSLRLLQTERRVVEARIRALKAEWGPAYRPELHGPFQDAGFDPAASPAFAHYAAGVGLDPRKLSKLHCVMFPNHHRAAETDPEAENAETGAVEKENDENEAMNTPEAAPGAPEIPALAVPDLLVMPGQQHLPVPITREFLTSTAEILPGDTRADNDDDPFEGDPPINLDIVYNGPEPDLDSED